MGCADGRARRTLADVSDSTMTTMLGSGLSLAGLAAGAVSWANEWTLFLPFAVVLVLFGIWLQLVAWSWRREQRAGVRATPTR